MGLITAFGGILMSVLQSVLMVLGAIFLGLLAFIFLPFLLLIPAALFILFGTLIFLLCISFKLIFWGLLFGVVFFTTLFAAM